MSEPIKLDRQAIAIIIDIAIRVVRRDEQVKLEQRANLRSVEGKKAA